MNITVAGAGYVGLVSAICLAQIGHNVTCIDVDADKIRLLQHGRCPIYEAGLDEMLQSNAPRLRFTTDAETAYGAADVIVIGVGTPENPDGSCDLRAVYAAADSIAQYARDGAIAAVKSTVPIGTCAKLQAYFDAKTDGTRRIRIASNPEFLSQGTAVQDTLHATRIVIGAEDASSLAVLREMVEPFGIPIVETDLCSAEMIKYASNSFLALKISFINEIANLCETVGADVADVAEGMGYDARIGRQFLRAGVGYGGSCFPKDTKALYWLSAHEGHPLKTVRAAIDVNETQKLLPLEKARALCGDLRGRTVAVLGLAFKPGTDDVRDAPSLKVVAELLKAGAHVRAWDPVAADRFASVFAGDVRYCACAAEALKDAELCIILTEWDAVCALTPEDFARSMRRPVVIDGRNCFKPERFIGTGVTYASIGRKPVRNQTERTDVQ